MGSNFNYVVLILPTDCHFWLDEGKSGDGFLSIFAIEVIEG